MQMMREKWVLLILMTKKFSKFGSETVVKPYFDFQGSIIIIETMKKVHPL